MRNATWCAAVLFAAVAMPDVARAQLLSGPVVSTEGIVEGDIFYVLPGQTVNIEADIVDGKVTNLRAVPVVVSSGKTFVAKFETMEGGGVMLTVESPFDQTLKFDLGMLVPQRDRMLKTSSCPIVPNGSIFEHWPHPILKIAVGRGRVIDKDAMTCE